jgi:transposase
MTRQWGRAPKGERIAEATPQGKWKVLTTLGAMSLRGIEAAMTVEAATDGEVFATYLQHVLCPKLRPGDVLVMDNLSAHKVAGIREMIQARGAKLIYLPPYSPDLNPIEKAWSKFKQFLRSVKARTKKPSIRPSPTPSRPLLRKMPLRGSAIPDMGHSNLRFALEPTTPTSRTKPQQCP